MRTLLALFVRNCRHRLDERRDPRALAGDAIVEAFRELGIQ